MLLDINSRSDNAMNTHPHKATEPAIRSHQAKQGEGGRGVGAGVTRALRSQTSPDPSRARAEAAAFNLNHGIFADAYALEVALADGLAANGLTIPLAGLTEGT